MPIEGLDLCEAIRGGIVPLPFDFDLCLPSAGEIGSASRSGLRMALGICSSRILMITDKCTPASTANKERFAHCVAVDLTSKPVTLSSEGPPPAPWKRKVSR